MASACAVALFLTLASLWQSAAGRRYLRQHETLAVLPVNSSEAPFQTCASLQNRGSHFTIKVAIGTPEQYFDLVADTGSNNCIVASCLCQTKTNARCSDTCLVTGVAKGQSSPSSTFHLYTEKRVDVTSPTRELIDNLPVVVQTFGSGDIASLIASDQVKVGKASAYMENGVLLMVKTRLEFDTPLEGIMGLGLPQSQLPTSAKANVDETAMEPGSKSVEVPGFLRTAGVGRFSMCFNDGQDGVLTLGGPDPGEEFASVGKVHWGLDFQGVTIGSLAGHATEAPPIRSQFCHPSTKEEGQTTACGFIPDSGTTLIMAPAAHLEALYGLLCDQWPRCVESIKANASQRLSGPGWAQGNHQVLSKAATFQDLLMRCSSWINETDEHLNELPEIHFHIGGAGGREGTLTLPGAGYVLEMLEDEVKYVRQSFGGWVFEVPIATGSQKLVCGPAFSSMDFLTKENGPVWILGTPLFYQYRVGYNLKSVPPSMSFSQEPCGECSEDVSSATTDAKKPATALLTNSHRVVAGGSSKQRERRTMPRRFSGPPRMPSFHTTSTL